MNKEQNDQVHAFQKKGLGTPPFTFSRVDILPSQTGKCAYCGHSLKILCVVTSSEGNEFTVGSDCVERVGEHGIGEDVQRAVAEIRAGQDSVRLAHLKEIISEESNRVELATKPHPSPFRRGKEGQSFMSYVDYCMGTAGATKLLEIYFATCELLDIEKQ